MREIKASAITDTIERLCIEANQVLPSDIKARDRGLPLRAPGRRGHLRHAHPRGRPDRLWRP